MLGAIDYYLTNVKANQLSQARKEGAPSPQQWGGDHPSRGRGGIPPTPDLPLEGP